MTSEKEKLEELLDSIKPDESRLTVNTHSKEEGPDTTKPEEEDKGIPASADPEPAKTAEELDHPFYTDDSDSFSDEKSNDSVDRMTDGPFSSDDSVQQSQSSSIDTEFPDTNQNRKRQTDTRSRSQGQRRQQPANQQGGVFIYNPQIVIQNGGERR